jgi:hypothetical protein
MQEGPKEHDEKEVPGLEDKDRLCSNYCSHSNWNWSPCKEKGSGNYCWGILSFELTQLHIGSLSCQSRLERWALYALPNQNSWSITCINHPMSAPVTESPSFLPHTWHTCSVCCSMSSQATQLEQLCDFYWLQYYREVIWTH